MPESAEPVLGDVLLNPQFGCPYPRHHCVQFDHCRVCTGNFSLGRIWSLTVNFTRHALDHFGNAFRLNCTKRHSLVEGRTQMTSNPPFDFEYYGRSTSFPSANSTAP